MIDLHQTQDVRDDASSVDSPPTDDGRNDCQKDFCALYEQHAAAAFNLALRQTGDRALAEDAVQEAMLRVWRDAASLRSDNARGWVLRIVGRECLRLQMARQRESKRVKTANVLRQRDSDYCEKPERETRLSALRHALARLSGQERSLLKLCYEEGLSQRRISSAIDIPQQTISNRLRRAVSRLSKELESIGLATPIRQ